VKAARESIELPLNGITQYDPDALTLIRLRYDSLVTRVRKTLGDPVANKEPLMDLYSNDLAAAKSDYQAKYVQWLHDRGLYESRQSLLKDNAIAKILWTDTVNNEAKSWLDYQLAYDKLSVYGVPPEEITPLLNGLDEQSFTTMARDKNALAEKASTTLRSPAAGIVIKRDVVQGNYYEPATVLMVIAPLDHLWVYANVYEADLELVRKGQAMDVEFPYLERSIPTVVDNIANQVDPETHAMRIRATIQNPGDLKSDMIVRAKLHIPGHEGDTEVPLKAVVATNNKYYVFVRNPDQGVSEARESPAKRKAEGQGVWIFERREIHVRHQLPDRVIVSDGLKPDEEVAGGASLILAEMYENLSTVETGMPP
jgi:cobalt-zinc-cadmium efflux system membrane fusion protein